MNVALVMVKQDGSSKEVPLTSFPASIGRGEEAKVRIPMAQVSRHHCDLLIDDDEELIVRDNNSSNGTFVNGERVKEHELVPGDLLLIGELVFVVRIDGHPKEIDAADAYAAGSVIDQPSQGASTAASGESNSPKPAGKPSSLLEDEGLSEGDPDDSDFDFDLDLAIDDDKD